MLIRLLKSSLRILVGISLLLALCATVGISTNTPPSSPAAEAAYKMEPESEAEDPTQDLGELLVSPEVD